MSNKELIHDFLKWLMDNYSIRLTMNESDSSLFERLYPDLASQLEVEDEAINNRAQRPSDEPR